MNENQPLAGLLCSNLPILLGFGFIAWSIWRSYGRILQLEEVTDYEKKALAQQLTAWMTCLLLAVLFLYPLPLPDSIAGGWDQVRGFLPFLCFAIVGYAGYNTIRHRVAGFGGSGQSVVTGQGAQISGFVLLVVDVISTVAYAIYFFQA